MKLYELLEQYDLSGIGPNESLMFFYENQGPMCRALEEIRASHFWGSDYTGPVYVIRDRVPVPLPLKSKLPSVPPLARCETCAFYRWGACHRYAPLGSFPKLNGIDFCGEWTEKKEG